jgi:hypothetical protein
MKTLLPLACIAIMLGTASCQQRMYFPDRANTPGLREGGEAKLTLALKPQTVPNTDSNQRGNPVSFGADFAVAPVNHLVVFGSYRSLNHRVIKEDHGDVNVYAGDFSGHRWEGGLGFFTTFDRLGKFEVLGGYGGGIIRRYSNESPERDYSSRYHRYFVQPALGVGNQMYSVTGGIRFAYQRFTDFSSRNPDLKYDIMRDSKNRDIEKEDIGFIEPFINGEVGWKYIKYNMQIGFSGQVMGGNIAGNLPFYVSMGLVFNIAPSYLRGEDNTGKKPRD